MPQFDRTNNPEDQRVGYRQPDNALQVWSSSSPHPNCCCCCCCCWMQGFARDFTLSISSVENIQGISLARWDVGCTISIQPLFRRLEKNERAGARDHTSVESLTTCNLPVEFDHLRCAKLPNAFSRIPAVDPNSAHEA